MGQAQTKKNKRKFDPREEYFIKNGGILLEKQIALRRSQDRGAKQLKIFSTKEIEKATNNFDPDLIVGSFREHTVYKGTLDGRKVAVKTPGELEPNPELIDLFLTEAAISVELHHSNLPKLYGCCLETYIPLLVYEFFPNPDLCVYLRGDKPFSWTNRLRVATDIAYALSYMHNALSKPVVHRDVMSVSILLDSSFNAKLGNSGYSVLITRGKTDQSLPVYGTPGYMDPEYIETKEVSDKCDVYSFGVLVLELLTGRKPSEMARSGTDLVDVFVSAVDSNCMLELIDGTILQQAKVDEIQQVARLALTCVAKKGDERPTMIDVVNQLRMICLQDKK